MRSAPAGTKSSRAKRCVTRPSDSYKSIDLRTADALQLAAEFFAAEARPSTLEFISLDDRLVAAARREGFLATKPRA